MVTEWLVAQWLEQQWSLLEDVGSSPTLLIFLLLGNLCPALLLLLRVVLSLEQLSMNEFDPLSKNPFSVPNRHIHGLTVLVVKDTESADSNISENSGF
jgi:hypothetical protein